MQTTDNIFEDNTFDINMVLMMVFTSLEEIRVKKNIELIYEIGSTIPKKLKGDAEALTTFLTEILIFICNNTQNREIVISLSAPQDFLYEEPICFEFKDTGIDHSKISTFIEENLYNSAITLDAKIEDNSVNSFQIYMPFKLNELGERRHYRLPNKDMLHKKVLLICDSQKESQSIKKMFEYFNYDVIVGFDEHTRNGNQLKEYDILLMEKEHANRNFEKMILEIQKEKPLKYVLLHNSHVIDDMHKHIDCTYLVKPIIQESIYELITSLFTETVKDANYIFGETSVIVNMNKYID